MASQSPRDRLLEAAKEALADEGLLETEIKSITIEVSKRALVCPPGMVPVWEGRRLADGSIVYGWECR